MIAKLVAETLEESIKGALVKAAVGMAANKLEKKFDKSGVDFKGVIGDLVGGGDDDDDGEDLDESEDIELEDEEE